MNFLTRKHPVNELSRIWDQLDDFSRLFEEVSHFHGLSSVAGVQSALISPSLDIIETEKDFVLSLEVPGISQSDLDISLSEDSRLIIKGEKKYQKTEGKEDKHVSERYYGTFRREIPLPSNCVADNMNATYKNGVVQIVLPKKVEVKPKIKKIDIKLIE
jgi:HSP20 family protein